MNPPTARGGLCLFMCFTCASYKFSTETGYYESTKTLSFPQRKCSFLISLRSAGRFFSLCLLWDK